MTRAARISVVVPVLNEVGVVEATLSSLQGLRGVGHEVIVVDGGSTDDTLGRARSLADQIFIATRGRATQMNAGAARAKGDVLLFLHADTRLPSSAGGLIAERVARGVAWGRFDTRLSGRHWLLRVIEALMNARSRLTGIATGDQAIFVTRDLFERVGGFPELALMEDVALSRLLRAEARPHCMRARVVTSSRRWEEHGILRTVVLMWRLRLAYAFGADPGRLARLYHRP